MSTLSRIGQGFVHAVDATGDWITKGNSDVVSCAKALIVGAGAVAVVAAPILGVMNHFEQQNLRDYARLAASIDDSPSVAFRSIADCVAKRTSEYICAAGERTALARDGDLGTSAEYSNMEACENNHGKNCQSHTYFTPLITVVGKTIIVNQVPHIDYKPTIVGWQAATNNQGDGLTLYATRDSSIGVRADGRKVNLGLGTN